MFVVSHAGMVVLQPLRVRRILMMLRRMDQNVKACPFSRRNRNHRDSEHLRKTMKVDLHASFFHNIHHIQCQDHRLAQLQKLQRQIKISLDIGCIYDIDNAIWLFIQNKISGNDFLTGIGTDGVDSRQIHH